MYFAVEDGRLLLKRLIAPSGCCEADNDYDTVPLLQRLPSRPAEALPAVLDIVGENDSTRRLTFRKKRDRCSRGVAEVKVVGIFFGGRCVAASV